MKRNRLGSKKTENLVYIHSTLRIIYQKDPGYKESPFKRWDQYTDDVVCVDEEIEPDGLVEIPPVAIDEEPPLDSDTYLESLLTEELPDVDVDADDSDVADAADLAEMD